MAFAFIGKALGDVSDVFRGSGAEVSNGRANRADDVIGVKRAFGALGRYEEPSPQLRSRTQRGGRCASGNWRGDP